MEVCAFSGRAWTMVMLAAPRPPPSSVRRSSLSQARNDALASSALRCRQTGAPLEFGLCFRRHSRCHGLPGILQARGTRPGKSGTVLCMARPRRVKMVAEQIKRELGDMMLTDTVLQRAVLPESALGADMYLSSLTTISDVELSKDLQVAKVYVSIYGDERGKEIVMEGLKSKTKYVRAGLGRRMSLRMTPEVRFIMDESLERGSRVLAILDKLGKERAEREARQMERNDSQDDNWNDVLDDEGGEAVSISHSESRE